MSTSTELIARLRLGASISRERKLNQGYDAVADEAADAIEALESQLKNASVSAIAEAAEVDRMKAEVERLTTLAHGQHIELYNARLQLAAAQGQEPVGTIHEDGYWVRANNPTGNAISDAMSIGKMNRLTVYAAPIPQQPEPSVDPRLNKLQEAVIEMYCDWKKGDFALPRLAQLDLEACFEAANCGEHFAAIKQAQPERAPDVNALYEELLYAVARKFPNETRHQTALKYIKRAEELSASTASDAAIKQGGQHD